MNRFETKQGVENRLKSFTPLSETDKQLSKLEVQLGSFSNTVSELDIFKRNLSNEINQVRALISDKMDVETIKALERRMENNYCTYDALKSVKMEFAVHAKQLDLELLERNTKKDIEAIKSQNKLFRKEADIFADFTKQRKEFDIKLNAYYTKNDAAKDLKKLDNKIRDLKLMQTENSNNIGYIQEEIRNLKQALNRKTDLSEFV